MVGVDQIKEYYSLCREFHEKVSDLTAKYKHNNGEIPIFVSCAMDTLVNELSGGEK